MDMQHDFPAAMPDPATVGNIAYAMRRTVRSDRTLSQSTRNLIPTLLDYMTLKGSRQRGYCWPSVADLTEAMGCSRSTVMRGLRGLGDRYIVYSPGKGRSRSRYRISPLFLAVWREAQPRSGVTGGVQEARSGAASEASPQPSSGAQEAQPQPRSGVTSDTAEVSVSAPKIDNGNIRSKAGEVAAGDKSQVKHNEMAAQERERVEARRREHAIADRVRQAAKATDPSDCGGWSRRAIMGCLRAWAIEHGIEAERAIAVIEEQARDKGHDHFGAVSDFNRIMCGKREKAL